VGLSIILFAKRNPAFQKSLLDNEKQVLPCLGFKSLFPSISDYFLGRFSNNLSCDTNSAKSVEIVIGQPIKGSDVFKPEQVEPQRCRSPSWVNFHIIIFWANEISFPEIVFEKQMQGSDIPVGLSIAFFAKRNPTLQKFFWTNTKKCFDIYGP
jgi:hypothetical protein